MIICYIKIQNVQLKYSLKTYIQLKLHNQRNNKGENSNMNQIQPK